MSDPQKYNCKNPVVCQSIKVTLTQKFVCIVVLYGIRLLLLQLMASIRLHIDVNTPTFS